MRIDDVELAQGVLRCAQEATSNAIRHGQATQIVITLTQDDAALTMSIVDDGSGFRAGARGYLLTDASPEEFEAAIGRIAAGQSALNPIAAASVRAALGTTLPASRAALTEREAWILRLVAGGYSNKEIARALGLVEGTVKNYISELLVKLEARDRTQAVLKAITLGLL